jgi:lysophospholipase L1-like esterase
MGSFKQTAAIALQFPALYSENMAIKIMPLGDSNTRGKSWDTAGYRDDLWNRLKANGFDVDFVGSQQDGSSLIDRDHEGHGGWRIDQIAGSLSSWLGRYTPNVVLLMVGTNDVLQDYQLGSATDRLSKLIDQVANQAPSAHVLVASISPITKTSSDRQQGIEFNSRIPGIVSAKASQGKRVRFVDVYSQLSSSDLSYDQVHPTAGGYSKIANAWYRALTGLPIWSNNPSPSPAPALSSTIRLEAERMSLTNFQVESNQSAASGGKFIGLFPSRSTTGSASAIFNGKAGTYDVVVSYFDEADGKSQLALSIGNTRTAWTLDKPLGGNAVSAGTRTSRTIAKGLTLQPGTAINLTGTANGDEWARVDYIDFIPTSSRTTRTAALSTTQSTASLGSPVTIRGTAADDVLMGNALDNRIRGWSGDDLLTGGIGRDRFMIAPGEGTDTIVDFKVGQDFVKLMGGLTLDQVAIVQGTGIQASDTLISLKTSGEVLAILSGISANTLTLGGAVLG